MSELVCQCCSQPKANLQRITSKLSPGWQLNMCATCLKLKYEPRWLIILSARQFGISGDVAKQIKDHRYIGSEIRAVDII